MRAVVIRIITQCLAEKLEGFGRGIGKQPLGEGVIGVGQAGSECLADKLDTAGCACMVEQLVFAEPEQDGAAFVTQVGARCEPLEQGLGFGRLGQNRPGLGLAQAEVDRVGVTGRVCGQPATQGFAPAAIAGVELSSTQDFDAAGCRPLDFECLRSREGDRDEDKAETGEKEMGRVAEGPFLERQKETGLARADGANLKHGANVRGQ